MRGALLALCVLSALFLALVFAAPSIAQAPEESGYIQPGEAAEPSDVIEIPLFNQPAPAKKPEKPDDSEEENKPAPNAVLLQGLNKVTARTSNIEAFLGVVTRFGNLEIIAHRCVEDASKNPAEASALLEIWELKTGESPEKKFQGWMFASTPAVSGLEHPVYDVSVQRCLHSQLQE